MESDDVPGAWTLPSLWTHRTRPQRLGKPHSTRFPTAPTRTIGFTEKKEQNPDVHPTPHTKFLTLPRSAPLQGGAFLCRTGEAI